MITDIEWVRDRRGHQVLQLRLDGQLAHIPSGQRVELTRRGLLKGVDFLMSDWRRNRSAHPFIRRSIEAGLSETDLAGCTDDPGVFALYEEMCRAIRTGTWVPRPRPSPRPSSPPPASAARTSGRPSGPAPGRHPHAAGLPA